MEARLDKSRHGKLKRLTKPVPCSRALKFELRCQAFDGAASRRWLAKYDVYAMRLPVIQQWDHRMLISVEDLIIQRDRDDPLADSVGVFDNNFIT